MGVKWRTSVSFVVCAVAFATVGALIGGGCAKGNVDFGSSSSSGSGGSTANGGNGGAGGGAAGAGGTITSPCHIDCATIKTSPCTTSTCNETTAQCVILPQPDDTKCEDGLFCTVQDTCKGGKCQSGAPNTCATAPPACHEMSCDEATKTCAPLPAQDGSFCTPDDKCQINGVCKFGSCNGTPNKCQFDPPPDKCHLMVCDPADGKCKPIVGNEGKSCDPDPNDLCTVGKSCSAGVCQSGAPKNCSALTVGCTLGVCDKADGVCKPQALKDGDTCDDFNGCTTGETCSMATCSSGNVVSACQDSDKCCPAGCNAANDSDCNVHVALGGDFSCAQLGDGTVWCWGYNVYGQLGNGSNTSASSPQKVVNVSGASSLATGIYHACAVTAGSVYCWGYNGYGQLGNNTKTNSPTPVQVMGIANAVTVTAGDYFSCAVLSDATMKCWGDNSNGGLGNGTLTQSSVPVAVSNLSNAVAAAAGYRHACALASTGLVSCWGYNVYGQLGIGSTIQQTTPQATTATNATSISAGYYNSCAVLADGTAKCWGYNGYGQLGTGSFTQQTSPTPVQNLSGVAAIGSGNYHTCAVLTNGTMKCWGYDFYGQLGDNASVTQTLPVAVQGILSGARSLEGGGYHTCAVLQGNIRCWGRNVYGQLGIGSTIDSHVPVTVGGL